MTQQENLYTSKKTARVENNVREHLERLYEKRKTICMERTVCHRRMDFIQHIFSVYTYSV